MSQRHPSAPFEPPSRHLLGPGPSAIHRRVYEALAKPLLGHLDPRFLELMDQTQDMLRQVFRTANPMTLTVSGTGTAGMEAALVNLVEPGDEVLVLVHGAFGARMAEIATRAGATVRRLERPWGEVFEPEEVADALVRFPRVRVVAVVHAETSTGALQPVREIGGLCAASDRLLLVDAVTSLGGLEVEVDGWQIDACYSGTQKCLGAPPGLAPLTLSPRAVARLRARRSKVQSWYLDLTLIEDYWREGRRAYHHTAPIALNYALHQALTLVLEEGLEARCERHRRNGRALVEGLEALGFRLFAREGHRLPVLTAVWIPEGVEDLPVRRRLLADHGIEIGGGLGPLAGKIWRIGLMGESSRRQEVFGLLAALEEILYQEGVIRRMGEGLEAASEVYRTAARPAPAKP